MAASTEKIELNDEKPTQISLSSEDDKNLDDPYIEAWKYIDKNNIIDLMQTLTSSIADKRPEDPLSFIVNKLQDQTQTSTEKSV